MIVPTTRARAVSSPCARAVSVLAALVTAGALLCGCSSGKPRKVVTVTVQPPAAPSSSGAPASAAGPGASGASSGAATSSASAITAQTQLPGTCASLLPDYAVARAAGTNSLPGQDAFVVGLPEPDIHRLAYINCQYGVTGAGAHLERKLEIGVSLYAGAADASARVSATVADYTNQGAQAQDATVDDRPATLLTGGAGAGYTDPLLVVAAGQRTVAVTVTAAVATGAAVPTAAEHVAALALAKTAS